jgi:hypothetical protein
MNFRQLSPAFGQEIGEKSALVVVFSFFLFIFVVLFLGK